MRFSELNLLPEISSAVASCGYEVPTPIQAQAIPPMLAGRDLVAVAQTGTGKTAAFAIPVLQQLTTRPGPRKIRALVLSPTRELATQIAQSFADYGRNLRIRTSVIFGGVSQFRQERDLAGNPAVVVATPGRLLDLLKQGKMSLANVELLILDEADRMLDMGFLPDVRRIVNQLPRERQTALFSATMPTAIRQLVRSMLKDPAEVAVSPVASTAGTISQGVYHCATADKRQLLERVLSDAAVARALVFTRTKRGADRVAKQLAGARIGAVAIHGNKSQNARERALDSFRAGDTRVLVATDIAARGLDVEGISHVINYDLPNVPESYVHRIGRTGRAGAGGCAVSFCGTEERKLLRDIERLIRQDIPVHEPPPRSQTPVRTEQRDRGPAPEQAGARARTGERPEQRQQPEQRPAAQGAAPPGRNAGRRRRFNGHDAARRSSGWAG
ncbi:MAG TPA: DEAD/DEAH box helicase [Polyangiaceae bacterium]|nr:DEAD/DEAH box helicase [Polyangiaceae bacterium]